jgi:hypothetical protein
MPKNITHTNTLVRLELLERMERYASAWLRTMQAEKLVAANRFFNKLMACADQLYLTLKETLDLVFSLNVFPSSQKAFAFARC